MIDNVGIGFLCLMGGNILLAFDCMGIRRKLRHIEQQLWSDRKQTSLDIENIHRNMHRVNPRELAEPIQAKDMLSERVKERQDSWTIDRDGRVIAASSASCASQHRRQIRG